jgi:hypothetical protein
LISNDEMKYEGWSTLPVMMTETWRDLISGYGSVRFAADVQPFSRFIPAYEALANETVELRRHNEELGRQLASAREAAAAAAAAASVAAPASATASASQQQIAKMQSKILELQDVVTAHYKQQAEGVRERLVMSESNQHLREEARIAVESERW